MRTPNRALSVEAVEDRSLPSTTFVFVDPTFSYRSHQSSGRSAMYSDAAAFRSFQAESVIRIRFSDNSVMLLRETPSGFQLIPIFGGRVPQTNPQPQPTVPNPIQGPIAAGETSSAGGPVRNTQVASSRGPIAPAGARMNVGDVAIAPTTQTTQIAVRTEADQAAATAAAQASTQSNQPVAALAPPLFGGHGNAIAYAFTAVNPETEVAPGEAMPPVDPTPMPGPAPTPTPDAGAESGLIQIAVAAVGPVAGMVPFDLTALSAGAGQFLDQVADLAPSWPDSMPAFTDSLWVATAAVLGGGAIYASRGRSMPRPGRDPLASALSEWERRNGRAAG